MSPPSASHRASEHSDSLQAFASEEDLSAVSPPKPSRLTVPAARLLLVATAVLILSGVALFALRRFPIPRVPQLGHLTVDTTPAGSDVLVDGENRGSTPIKLTLAPGQHTITIRNGSDTRVVPLTIAAGAEVSHSFEMRTVEPAAAGGLSVVTDPPGARVAVDGKPRGVSPLTMSDLTIGEHHIVVTGDAGELERTVTVAAGTSASVMFSLPRLVGPVGGWLSVSSRFDVDVVEHGEVIGTSGMARIMLASGRHDIVLLNPSIGYTDARTITVAPGKTVSIRIDAPKVPVSLNARPWADITVDGDSVGQTPIANLPLTIGSHEIVFRHPQFAERKQTVVVTTKGPNRITADLTK